MLIVILIFCQGGLHDRGVHLPWGPTWWQRGGHFAGAPCTRKNKCAQTLVAGPHSRSTRTKTTQLWTRGGQYSGRQRSFGSLPLPTSDYRGAARGPSVRGPHTHKR